MSTLMDACVNNTVFGLFNMPCSTDASAGILKEIFGNQVAELVGMPTLGKASLIPHFIHNFNMVLMSGALLIYAIIVVAGTINTGHHGKFLGQQWDSIWTPLRVVGSTALMLPLKYGLCSAQIVVISFILYGAHAATVVWHESLDNVYYGVPPTVPASGMSMVKQAVANDIIMATYEVLAGDGETSLNPGSTNTPLFDKQNSALQQHLVTLLPAMCKTALGLVTQGKVLADKDIVGDAKKNLQACLDVADDFMQKQTPYFVGEKGTDFDNLMVAGSYPFDDNNEPLPVQQGPTMWVGPIPEYANCLTNGTITSACYQAFPGGNTLHYPDPSMNEMVDPAYTVNFTDKNGVTSTLMGSALSINYDHGYEERDSADGRVVTTRNIELVPASDANTAQQNLDSALKTYVKANITNPQCRNLNPPDTCSNNINDIITAFNTYLQTSSHFPDEGYQLSGSEMTPSTMTDGSENPLIPGAHRQLNSSWWNAGEVYLIIDQKMAENLSALLNELSNLNTENGLDHFVLNGTATLGITMSLLPVILKDSALTKKPMMVMCQQPCYHAMLPQRFVMTSKPPTHLNYGKATYLFCKPMRLTSISYWHNCLAAIPWRFICWKESCLQLTHKPASMS